MNWRRWRPGRAGRELLSSTGLRFVAIAVAVGASVLVARLGGPDAKGIASTFAAVATMSFAVTNFGVPEQVVQVATTTSAGARQMLVKVWLWYATATVAIGTVLALTVGIPPGALVVGCLCYLVPTQAALVALGFSGVQTQALGALLQPVGLAMAALVFALDGALTGYEAALATALSYLLPMVVYWRAIPPRPSGDPPPSVLDLLRHGSKWQIPQVAQRLVQRSDILIVFALFGPARAGIYSIASQLSELCFTVTRQVAGQTYHHAVTGVAVSLKRSVLVATVASLVTAVGIGAVGALLITTVYGTAFADARTLLIFLLPGPVLGGAALVILGLCRAERLFVPAAASSSAAALVAVVASLGLAPTWGASGVAIGSTLGWAVYSIVIAYVLRAHRLRAGTSGSSAA